MSARINAAQLFSYIFDLIAAAIGKAAALRDSIVQAARRQYLEACANG